MLSPHIPPKSLPAPSGAENEAKVRATYNAVAETYDTAYLHPKDFAENRHVCRELLLGGLVKPGSDILDAGCGTGFLLDELGPMIEPRNYVGLDISDGMLRQAAKKHPGYVFLNASMEQSGLPTEGVDAAVSLFGCFNYCRPDAALADLRAVLKPGGRLFLMVCTPRHAKRSSYVVKDAAPGRTLYTADQARSLVSAYFMDVQVQGMSWLIDFMPRWLPSRVFNAVMALEQRTVAKWFPSSCYYLLITGTKAAQVYALHKR